MFTAFPHLNWTAVAVATLASFVLGALWFTVLFGKPYARALGRAHVPGQKPGMLFIAGPFACGLATTVASAVLIKALKLESVGQALAFGAVVGLGYLAATTVNTAINPNMPRPLFYGLISGSYFFVSGVVASVILVGMN
jgi:MFS family permease